MICFEFYTHYVVLISVVKGCDNETHTSTYYLPVFKCFSNSITFFILCFFKSFLILVFLDTPFAPTRRRGKTNVKSLFKFCFPTKKKSKKSVRENIHTYSKEQIALIEVTTRAKSIVETFQQLLLLLYK